MSKPENKVRANHSPLRELQVKLRERMNELSDVTTTGSCADFAAYKELCGKISGLAFAERELLDLDDLMDKAEE